MKNLIRTVFVLLACAALLWTTNAFATIQSTFDLNGEGWRDLTYSNLGVFISDNGLANFDALFGNPAGSVDTTDPGGTVAARFGAPAGYLGNKSGFIGGSITFQLIIKAMPGVVSLPTVPGVVAFENSAMNRGIGYTGPLPNAATWTTYTAQLSPNGLLNPLLVGYWGAFDLDDPTGTASQAMPVDFTDVLGNVTGLTINGEVTDGTDDTIALENVHFVIPIPAALPLMASALFGLGFAARRRLG